MSRFVFSEPARRDLDQILEYLDSLPSSASLKIGAAIQACLSRIAREPQGGSGQSALTLLAGFEVRSRLCSPYRIFYSLHSSHPEILGIIHTSRDLPSLMEKRLQ